MCEFALSHRIESSYRVTPNEAETKDFQGSRRYDRCTVLSIYPTHAPTDKVRQSQKVSPAGIRQMNFTMVEISCQ